MADVAALAKRFGVVDYVVFGSTLAISAGIGIYFGCTGGKQKTTKEFLMANRSMSVLPVAMSLLASFMSAITILGTPAETYTKGTIYIWVIFAYIGAVYFGGYIYIPVFYGLKLTSAYEYLEIRFSRIVRVIGACIYILQMALYMAMVLYAPSLALSAVTGLNVWIAVTSVGVVCTFYTAIGGMKAVMWTDTFQIVVMISGMLAVFIQGCINQGISTIWQNNMESGRIDFYNWPKVFNPNPLERHTFWTLVVGGTFVWTATYGANQAQVQRAMTVPNLKSAQLAYWINLPGLAFLALLASATGLVMYSHYKDCDPLTKGIVQSSDQLFPLYVMEVLGFLTGVPGLVVASVFSGALSTVSSGLNSLAAVTITDIVKTMISSNMSDERAAKLSKVIAACYGLVSIGLAFVVSQLGGILEAALSLFGILGGPILGVFSLGMFFPCANKNGALLGLLSSLGVTLWIGIGAQVNKPPVHLFPVSTDGCPIEFNQTTVLNHTSILNTTTAGYITTVYSSQLNTTSAEHVAGSSIYHLSYQYMALVAVIVCIVVGLCASYITGFTPRDEVDPRLISPLFDHLLCCLPKSWRSCCYCGVNHSNKYCDEGEEESDSSYDNVSLSVKNESFLDDELAMQELNSEQGNHKLNSDIPKDNKDAITKL